MLDNIEVNVTGSAVRLHNAHVELQALISRRLAMVAANHASEFDGRSPEYTEAHFDALVAQMRECWIDPGTVE